MLPGRVAATPPVGNPYVSPYVWIDQPEGAIQTVGTNTRLSIATFPVWIGYDGAVKAQVLGLDDLVAKVWDACFHVPAARPVGWSPSVFDVGGTAVRGVVVNVDVTLGALTLCLPTVEVSLIPPNLNQSSRRSECLQQSSRSRTAIVVFTLVDPARHRLHDGVAGTERRTAEDCAYDRRLRP